MNAGSNLEKSLWLKPETMLKYISPSQWFFWNKKDFQHIVTQGRTSGKSRTLFWQEGMKIILLKLLSTSIVTIISNRLEPTFYKKESILEFRKHTSFICTKLDILRLNIHLMQENLLKVSKIKLDQHSSCWSNAILLTFKSLPKLR